MSCAHQAAELVLVVVSQPWGQRGSEKVWREVAEFLMLLCSPGRGQRGTGTFLQVPFVGRLTWSHWPNSCLFLQFSQGCWTLWTVSVTSSGCLSIPLAQVHLAAASAKSSWSHRGGVNRHFQDTWLTCMVVHTCDPSAVGG